jgi:hypothetical protein
MAVVGGGDGAGEKHNNRIEATKAAVGIVGTTMDSGEARAKGEMSGWRMIQCNRAADWFSSCVVQNLDKKNPSLVLFLQVCRMLLIPT